MTSGEAVKYKGSLGCFVKNEGAMSLMKGAGANILRGVAGAGVLAGFDKFKELYVRWRLADEVVSLHSGIQHSTMDSKNLLARQLAFRGISF